MTRTHVVMADEVIQAIDALVGERRRSRFIEEAAREKLDRMQLEAALRATSGIASAARHPEWRDRRAASTWVRSVRQTETER
jgi:metal-responsive CopG/Arc/MetJ family transcriptional regulator